MPQRWQYEGRHRYEHRQAPRRKPPRRRGGAHGVMPFGSVLPGGRQASFVGTCTRVASDRSGRVRGPPDPTAARRRAPERPEPVTARACRRGPAAGHGGQAGVTRAVRARAPMSTAAARVSSFCSFLFFSARRGQRPHVLWSAQFVAEGRACSYRAQSCIEHRSTTWILVSAGTEWIWAKEIL